MKIGMMVGAILLVGACSLTGCVAEEDSSISDEVVGDVQMTPEDEGVEGGADGFDSTEREEVQDVPVYGSDLLIGEAGDFHDGVAWVDTGETGMGHDYLVDRDGRVLIDYVEQSRAGNQVPDKVSSFCSGTALVQDGDAFCLINHQGESVVDIVNEAFEEGERVFGSDSVKRVEIAWPYEDNYRGYVLVTLYLDTFDYTGEAHGVIAGDGSWAIDFPAISSMCDGSDGSDPDPYVLQAGNSAVLTRTGEVVDSPSTIGYFYQFEYNGEMLEHTELRKREVAKEHNGYPWDIGGVFDDGSAYENPETGERLIVEGRSKGIVSGEEFNGGYAIVTITNNGGSGYLTVIDTSGSWLFDPVKDNGHSGVSPEGFFYVDGEDGEGSYRSVSGDLLSTVRGYDGTAFSEGRAWITIDGSRRCVDENGEIVF